MEYESAVNASERIKKKSKQKLQAEKYTKLLWDSLQSYYFLNAVLKSK